MTGFCDGMTIIDDLQNRDDQNLLINGCTMEDARVDLDI